MRHYRTYGAILSGAGLLIACAERDRAPTGLVSVPTVAPPFAAIRIANPRAIFSDSGFATGVAGDGRAADGSGVGAAESVYEDGRCGVTSEIFAASSKPSATPTPASK